MAKDKEEIPEEELSTEGFDADGSEIELVQEDEPKKASKKGKKPEAQEEAGAAEEKYLYLRAEFENFKRQAIKERSDLVKYGSERILRDILDVLDNFDRALETELTTETLQSFREGIDMTAKELRAALERHGLKEGDGLVGAAFDPMNHEALSSEETDKVPPGHISQVFKKAYWLHDRVIRPAQVVVAKAVSEANKTQDEPNAPTDEGEDGQS